MGGGHLLARQKSPYTRSKHWDPSFTQLFFLEKILVLYVISRYCIVAPNISLLRMCSNCLVHRNKYITKYLQNSSRAYCTLDMLFCLHNLPSAFKLLRECLKGVKQAIYIVFKLFMRPKKLKKCFPVLNLLYLAFSKD